MPIAWANWPDLGEWVLDIGVVVSFGSAAVGGLLWLTQRKQAKAILEENHPEGEIRWGARRLSLFMLCLVMLMLVAGVVFLHG